MINFGTGGWRAIIGKDFVYDNITRVAMGVVSLARKEGKTDKPIVVGYDRRFLSQCHTGPWTDKSTHQFLARCRTRFYDPFPFRL